jgi:predicted small secreted protein
VRRGRAFAAVLVVAALLLAGCGIGNDVRDHLEDAYELQNRTGDSATYLAPTPVGSTTAAIAAAVPPAARQAEGGAEYLRYDDDIVIVSAAPGGSTVHVEDLDERYRSGYFVFLGPGFRPGSPAGGAISGGPGDSK